jgi:hypothetical protein
MYGLVTQAGPHELTSVDVDLAHRKLYLVAVLREDARDQWFRVEEMEGPRDRSLDGIRELFQAQLLE